MGMKKYILPIIVLLFLITGIATAQIGGVTLWYLDGTVLKPVDPTWTLGVGGLAPNDATYITQIANGDLSAEQALSGLASGIMRVANTTGVITSLTDSAGIATNISDETGTGILTFATNPVFTTSISLGATGVKISEDSDGALTFLGLSGGYDEDFSINLDDVENTIGITTSTGVTSFNFGAIDITAGDLTAKSLYIGTDESSISAPSIDDGNYTSFTARDSDTNSLVPIGTMTGASDPYFSLGGAMEFKFYNSGYALVALDKQLRFGDSGVYILSDDDGHLDLTADTSIDLNATTTLGANNLLMTGSIADTTNRVLKGWFTDLEVTNAIAGSITGSAGNVEGTDLGTLTDTKVCTYDLAGTEIDCATTMTPDEVGTLTNTKWCTTDGSVVNCATNAPVLTEVDPTALLTAGTDNVKDTHIDWGTGAGQVSPADFANQDIGDITITTGDWAVENDSHTHGSSSIAGLDISDDTNLGVGFALDMATDTIDFDPTEITGGTTWDDGGEATVVWVWSLSGATDPQITFANDLMTLANSLTLTTGNNFILGTTQ
jgi:hypothetical protein